MNKRLKLITKKIKYFSGLSLETYDPLTLALSLSLSHSGDYNQNNFLYLNRFNL